MATAKKIDNGAAETMESFATAQSEAMKDGFEKVMTGFSKVGEFNKSTFDAYVTSANAVTKNFEALTDESATFAKKSVEDSMAAAKAAASSRSVQELIELNTDYVKSTFEGYMSQMNKMTDMMLATAKDASDPINERYAALVEMVQSYRP